MTGSAEGAAALVRALLDHGVRDVVLCPGSRSAPLAYALEAAERTGEVRLHVRHDERTAAFVALGCAAADPSVPAAVVTTSGTAVANLHPAVMEAHHAGLPLLLLTADRPASVRGTWANQTSELQPEVFGAATALTEVVEAGEVTDWRALAGRVVRAATGATDTRGGLGRPGPVHLDLGFDDPLVPDGVVDLAAAEMVSPLRRPEAAATTLQQGPRTLVVAGAGAGAAARVLAESAGWPLLPEPSSGATGGPHRVGAYRLLLETALADRVERVVVLGRPTLSRPVTRLLARDDVELVQVVAHRDDAGPARAVRRVLGSVEAAPVATQAQWLRTWVDAGVRAEAAVDAVLDGRRDVVGPWLARAVARATRPEDVLVVASSNPVRDLDLVAPPADGARVLANRGVSGIDGTVSTAVGAAAATGRATRLLVGDLAALHDLGGLVVPPAERSRLRLQVVVLDDDGGGIFGLLEHASFPHAFERVFGTPHGVDLAAAAAALGVTSRRTRTRDDVEAAVRDVPEGISVLIVPADRSALAALHQELRTAAHAAVAPTRG